jgi:hypothetical protein
VASIGRQKCWATWLIAPGTPTDTDLPLGPCYTDPQRRWLAGLPKDANVRFDELIRTAETLDGRAPGDYADRANGEGSARSEQPMFGWRSGSAVTGAFSSIFVFYAMRDGVRLFVHVIAAKGCFISALGIHGVRGYSAL